MENPLTLESILPVEWLQLLTGERKELDECSQIGKTEGLGQIERGTSKARERF